MKKSVKIISAMLIMALVLAAAAVSAIAAAPDSVRVAAAPERLVYYVGADDTDDMILCDPTGMKLEVAYADGTTEIVDADEDNVFFYVEDYTLGENEAVVEYYADDEADALTTTLTVTVEASPVAKIEITKMPNKVDYDMDKDVLTKDSFTLDKLYALDPEGIDELLADMGMTFEELKAFYAENPEAMNMVIEILFQDSNALLLFDEAGMEILVTFKDGTTQTVTADDMYCEYNGAFAPIYVDQKSGDVTEGANVMVLSIFGVEKEFSVNVKKSAATTPDNPATPDKTPDKKPDAIPSIPDTSAGASVAAFAVIALMSGCGVALIPSKKEK